MILTSKFDNRHVSFVEGDAMNTEYEKHEFGITVFKEDCWIVVTSGTSMNEIRIHVNTVEDDDDVYK